MTISRPLALTALALSTILATSACGSPEGTPAQAPSSTSASPSESTDPEVPAGWKTVDLDTFAEVSVPPNWEIKSTNASIHTLKAPTDEGGLAPGWATVNVGNLAGGDQAKKLDESAKWAMENDYSRYAPKRLPDEVVNGTTFFRLQFESASDWYDVLGTVTPGGDHQIVFEWKFLKSISRKEAEAIWSPVMPTFTML